MVKNLIFERNQSFELQRSKLHLASRIFSQIWQESLDWECSREDWPHYLPINQKGILRRS